MWTKSYGVNIKKKTSSGRTLCGPIGRISHFINYDSRLPRKKDSTQRATNGTSTMFKIQVGFANNYSMERMLQE